jgi:hypothetical protein
VNQTATPKSKPCEKISSTGFRDGNKGFFLNDKGKALKAVDFALRYKKANPEKFLTDAFLIFNLEPMRGATQVYYCQSAKQVFLEYQAYECKGDYEITYWRYDSTANLFVEVPGRYFFERWLAEIPEHMPSQIFSDMMIEFYRQNSDRYRSL